MSYPGRPVTTGAEGTKPTEKFYLPLKIVLDIA